MDTTPLYTSNDAWRKSSSAQLVTAPLHVARSFRLDQAVSQGAALPSAGSSLQVLGQLLRADRYEGANEATQQMFRSVSEAGTKGAVYGAITGAITLLPIMYGLLTMSLKTSTKILAGLGWCLATSFGGAVINATLALKNQMQTLGANLTEG